MINRLKFKFVALSMTSLLVLLIVIVSGMNIINYQSVVSEADAVLEILSQNKGVFPEADKTKGDRMPHGMSPELPYESRFFSVLIDTYGEITKTDTKRIESVDSEQAAELAEEVLGNGRESGFIENFRYVVKNEVNDTRITFLDCGRKLDAFKTFLTSSIGMALAGFIIGNRQRDLPHLPMT